MRTARRCIPLILLLVLLAACATTAIGKAVQSAEAQKKLVEGAMVEVAKLHLQGKMPESDYAKAKKDYQAWADVQNALAASLATWKAVSTAENGQKVSASLQRLGPLTDSLLNFLGRFVDLAAVKQKISALDGWDVRPPDPRAVPLLVLEMEAALELARDAALVGRR